jgi:LysM repeat protein
MFVGRDFGFAWTVVIVAGLLMAPGRARADEGTWTVQRGDVLSSIADRFDVSVEQLRQWNGIQGDTIRPGQRLRVEPDTRKPKGFLYEVQRGETLSGIAVRFDTTVDEIVELNPDLDRDRIREGQEIRIDGGHALEYEVRKGDTLSRIAAYHRVSIEQIKRWNPGIDPDHIRIGARLKIYSDRPPSLSESIGLPYDGKLVKPVRLPPHPGYAIRDRSKAWGTRETVEWLLGAFDHVRSEHPNAPRVSMHDLSDRDGGFLYGHNSHQSGRDADLAYYQKKCEDGVCPFRPISSGYLDVERTWSLLEYWLSNDLAEAIFIDYELQSALYKHAREQGATRKQLHEWFQYPRGRTFPVGVVRHYPKHDDHIHVRFVCPRTDDECEE